MIDLYAAATSNGIRVKIMLEECNLAYRLNVVDIFAGAHREPDFLAINPQGLTPAIVDRDGPDGNSLTMAQSGAILAYLADKTGRFGIAGAENQPLFRERYVNILSDMGPTLSTIFAIVRSENPHAPTQQMFEERFSDFLRVWDDALGTRANCGGEAVSIADFAMFGTLVRCKQVTPHLMEGHANIDRWYAAMEARPGVQRGLDFGQG